MPKQINSKKQFEFLEVVNGVPKVIWCYWAGGPMNAARSKSFGVLRANIGVTICLITKENITDFVNEEYPLHQAFGYLSAVHQSDYLRAYLLHNYGGGWHDIKATLINYEKFWDFFSDPKIYLVGKPEVKGGPSKVFDTNGRWMPDFWSDLVSAIAWVGRPRTPLSRSLLTDMEAHLDANFELLKKNPGVHPREKKLEVNNPITGLIKSVEYRLKGKNPKYPLRWTFFGDFFHPLNYFYRDHISNQLPVDEQKNAGIYHR